MPHLFEPLTLRSINLKNRIGMSPMCMYSAAGGAPRPWHMAHLGSRAVGGVGLVLTEATAVDPIGRISPLDTGIWDAKLTSAWRPVASFIGSQGAVPGLQLAHAGRKAGTAAPQAGGAPLDAQSGGWEPVAPSPVPFAEGYPVPRELRKDEIEDMPAQWASAAVRAVEAGFGVVELHMAHGYLLHEFLSPLSNRRMDEYGGSLENRMRFPLAVARAVRAEIPGSLPLLVRISVTDWVRDGWTPEQSVIFARSLAEEGVDLIDCSSGGIVPGIAIPAEAGYQVAFAEQIRREAGILTAAVGLITEPGQADAIIRQNQADLVLLGRALLWDPYWALRAATALGHDVPWPNQYARAAPNCPRGAIP